MPQTKEQKAIYDKEYREKNKEKKKEQDRLYYIENKEKFKERGIEYRENNKDKISEQQRLYRINNKEKIKEYNLTRRPKKITTPPIIQTKEERSNKIRKWQKTEKGMKSRTMANWRGRRLLDNFNDNYETIYRIYLSTKFCDDCGYELNTGDTRMKKCLDHCHQSGYFRGVVCNSCNVRRC